MLPGEQAALLAGAVLQETLSICHSFAFAAVNQQPCRRVSRGYGIARGGAYVT